MTRNERNILGKIWLLLLESDFGKANKFQQIKIYDERESSLLVSVSAHTPEDKTSEVTIRKADF